jgi:hypothetical protein
MEVKWSLVQISVVVAIIQTSLSFFTWEYGKILSSCVESRALKAVVEKVSLRLAIMQRSVGPKYPVKTTKQSL